MELARQAARVAGVTRLADVSGLAPFGIPVFQAVRPEARLLSVSQGKGLTRMAAMVSALLEAVELDRAERLPPPGDSRPLESLPDQRDLWHRTPRHPLAIRLDPAVSRGWLPVTDLVTGRRALAPWDLFSLDTTRPLSPDILPSSVGLATGNDEAEACIGAVAELIEHDLQAETLEWSPADRRAAELDLATVDDPHAARLIDRIRRRGFAVRAWSMGQAQGIAAFCCAVTDVAPLGAVLQPAGGTGCHPDRATALLRALLEAVQSRIMMIAGSRDDLDPDDYRDGAARTTELVLQSLSFGRGPLAWADVPNHPALLPEAQLDRLLKVTQHQSSLPVLLHRHESPVEGLTIVHALAPGLRDLLRKPLLADRHSADPLAPGERGSATHGGGRSTTSANPSSSSLSDASSPWRGSIATSLRKAPVLFVGPSLASEHLPTDMDVRGPAVCGDLAALLTDPPSAVGLIDGAFETAPTVWHKEILELIAHGIPVAGAASLGALRAAELHQLGMIGVGRIFAAYRDGGLVRDDAVLLTHAPRELEYRPLTVALVDAEAALLDADLPPEELRQLQRIVRTADFHERSWGLCLDRYRQRTGKAASRTAEQFAALATLKQEDALALVARLREGLPRPAPVTPPPMTALYRVMLERRALGRPPARSRKTGHVLLA